MSSKYMSARAYLDAATASIVRRSWQNIFGSMIEASREAAGLSIEQAARLAGLEASEWGAIETGCLLAAPDWLRPMADALGVRYDQMWGWVYLCQDAWENEGIAAVLING